MAQIPRPRFCGAIIAINAVPEKRHRAQERASNRGYAGRVVGVRLPGWLFAGDLARIRVVQVCEPTVPVERWVPGTLIQAGAGAIHPRPLRRPVDEPYFFVMFSMGCSSLTGAHT
jgi:hypothetical protein